MAMAGLLMLVAAQAAQAVPGVAADPLAPAAAGQVQCYRPDERRRTCRSIAAYRRTGEGTYANTATVLVSPTGPVTLETVTPVTVAPGGAVCGAIRAEDIAVGRLRAGGRLLAAAEAAPLLARLAEGMAPLVGKAICTTYERTADGLVARATVAGVYRADADQRVIWVGPADGYTVSP